jgi:hypothetical protein
MPSTLMPRYSVLGTKKWQDGMTEEAQICDQHKCYSGRENSKDEGIILI